MRTIPNIANLSTRLDVIIKEFILSITDGIKCSNANPFVPNAPFLYPLKTSKNLRFSDIFMG